MRPLSLYSRILSRMRPDVCMVHVSLWFCTVLRYDKKKISEVRQ